jgi:hypothetical protein
LLGNILLNMNLPPTPGLIYAALISPTGHLLASVGQASVEAPVAAVLAQGAVAAAADLALRSHLGTCRELHAACDNGGLLMTSDASGQVALLQYAPGASLEQLRHVARAMLMPAPQQQTATPATRQSLMDALNAAPP